MAIEISTLEQLQAMKDNLSADYVLVNNIDASDTAAWNDGAGFEPIGNVMGSGSFIGGLVGRNQATVNQSYWDTQTSGQGSSAAGTGLTTAEMQDPATFAAWIPTSGCYGRVIIPSLEDSHPHPVQKLETSHQIEIHVSLLDV